MLKEAETSGKTARRRIRKLPKVLVLSEFKRPPKNLSIDYYDPSWFNQLLPDQKRSIANIDTVTFLPNAAQSLSAVLHPDEKLGDKVFAGKYCDILVEPYELSDEEEDFEDHDKDSGSDTSIDLEAESDGEDEDEDESDAYSEGNYGDLYEDKGEGGSGTNWAEKGKEVDGGKGSAAEDDDDDSEDSDWMAED